MRWAGKVRAYTWAHPRVPAALLAVSLRRSQKHFFGRGQVTVSSVVVDAYRLPFTVGTVVSAAPDEVMLGQ